MALVAEQQALPMDEEEQTKTVFELIVSTWQSAHGLGCDSQTVVRTTLGCAILELVQTYGRDSAVELLEDVTGKVRGGHFDPR